MYFHFSGMSADTHYSSVDIDITYQQGAINANISLFGRCHMNYYGIKFTLFLKSWHVNQDFLSLSLCINSYYESHVSVTTSNHG